MVLISLSLYMLHNATIHSTYKDFWLPLLLFGIGIGVSFPCSPSLGMSALPVEKIGEGSGIINTINYYFGVLCVSIGTLVSIYIGRASLKTALLAEKLPKDSVYRFSEAIFGHKSSLHQLANHFTPHQQQEIFLAAQQATVRSFSATMLMCALVALLGAVGILFLVTASRGRKKGRVRKYSSPLKR